MSEIQKVLANEITPTLERLRSEKKHYLKWSANNTEIEKLQRLCVAYQYSKAAEEVEKSADELKQMEDERERYVLRLCLAPCNSLSSIVYMCSPLFIPRPIATTGSRRRRRP